VSPRHLFKKAEQFAKAGRSVDSLCKSRERSRWSLFPS
jgi:hypothetical protein